MSIREVKKEPSTEAQNILAITLDADSSSTSSQVSDYLISQFETLSRSNFLKYNDCLKHQEELRLRLIEEKNDFDYFRLWLQKVGEDCFLTEFNYEDLKKNYDLLSKRNEFLEHGVAQEKLKLKFCKVISHCNDLKMCLDAVDGDIKSLKSEYEKVAQKNMTVQKTSFEETLECAKREKPLQLKSIDVIYECKRLDTLLNGVSREIIQLNSEHVSLTQQYQALKQDTIVQEFLNQAKFQETPQSQLNSEQNKLQTTPITEQRQQPIEGEYSSLDECTETISEMSTSRLKPEFLKEDVTFLKTKIDEMEKLLVEERQQRTQMDAFSENLCHLLLKYQRQLQQSGIADNAVVANRDSFQNNSTENEVKNSIIKSLAVSSGFLTSTAIKTRVRSKNTGSSLASQKNITTRVSTVISNEISGSSSAAGTPATQESRKSKLGRTLKHPKPPKRKRQSHAVTNFYCKICDRYYTSENYLRHHELTAHGRPKKSSVGGKKLAFKRKESRKVSTKRTPLHPYKCSYCDWTANISSDLKKHLRNVHNRGENLYYCAHCGQKFVRKENLFHHICSEHFSGTLEHFKCLFCGVMFPAKVLLYRHHKTYHLKSAKKA